MALNTHPTRDRWFPGAGGLIVVEQEAFESLDPANRQFVAEHARRRKVTIITAEATDGALRAELYQEGKA